MLGVAQRAAGGYSRAEHALAFNEGGLPKVVTIDIKQVESEERNRIRLAQGCHILRGRADTWLYLREARYSVLVEGNDLAVKHRRLCVQMLRDSLQLGILRLHGFARSPDQPNFLVVQKAQCANPIPL